MLNKTYMLRKDILNYLCSAPEIDTAMGEVLAMVGKFFNADRVYVFENSPDDLCCSNTYEWCNEGIKPEMDNLQNLRYLEDLGGNYQDNFDENGLFLCHDIHDLPGIQVAILEPQDIFSMLQCAIMVQGKFRGYIGFDKCSATEKGWENDTAAIETLAYIAQLISLYLMDYRQRRAEVAASEVKAQQAKDLFEDLLENVVCGVAILRISPEKDVSLEYANDGLCKMIGCSRAALMVSFAKDRLFSVAPEYRETVAKAMREISAEGGSNSFTYQALTADGSRKWIIGKNTSSRKADNSLWLYTTFYDVTNEINTQIKLQESEELAQAACNFAGMWAWIYDIENNAAHNFIKTMEDFGVPEVLENLNKTEYLQKIILPGSVSVVLENVEKIKQGADGAAFECQLRIKSGRVHWCWVRMNRLQKTPNLILCSIQIDDISHDLRVQQSLERKKRLMGDKSLLRYCVTNLTADRVLEYQELENAAPTTVVGMTLAQATEMAMDGISLEAGKELYTQMHNLQDLLAAYADGITTRSFELHRLNAKGESIWQKGVQNILRDTRTGDVFLYEYCYDIHRQKLLEETLQAALETSYDLFGSLQMPLEQITIIKDKNHADSQDMLIGNYNDWMAVNSRDCIPENEREDYLKAVSLDVVKARLAELGVYEFMHNEYDRGELRIKRSRFSYYDRESGIVLLTRIDITDAVRSAEKKQQELESALELATEATNAKTDFLARMSHEIRTPMNGIVGMTRLAMDAAIEPKVKEYLGQIDESSRYMFGLLNDMLDMNSIIDRKLSLERKWVNENHLLASCISMAAPKMAEKDLKFIYSGFENETTEIYTDPLRTKQIIMNLLSNACKYTQPGGTVVFEWQQMAIDGAQAIATIIVRDTGCGMSKEYLEHGLFGAFSQDECNYAGAIRGTGLGLAIVKQIVDRMNGTIQVQSELNKGTEFVVNLRVSYRNEPLGEDAAPAAGEAPRNKRILVADDHPLNRKIVKALLERRNMEVELASDGQEALDLFAASPLCWYDAILMDIKMPVMDGIQATRFIRALVRGDAKTVPIIAVTANAYESDVKTCLDAGMNAHLAKPIEPEALYAAIAKCLEP